MIGGAPSPDRKTALTIPPDGKDEVDVEAEVVVEGYLWTLTENYRASTFYFDPIGITFSD